MNALYIPLSIQQSIINENTENIQLIVDRCVLDATSCWGANCTTPIKNSKININKIIGTALGCAIYTRAEIAKPFSAYSTRVLIIH